MMKRVGAPAVSPDGKWVVFSVTEPSYEPDKEVSDLWLVPADGGAAPQAADQHQGGRGRRGLVAGQPLHRLHHQARG